MENFISDLNLIYALERDKVITERLQLVSNNELLYIFKKEWRLPLTNFLLTRYYFRCEHSQTISPLTKRNLRKAYQFTEYENGLKMFLRTSKIMRKDHATNKLMLLHIINVSVPENALQLLKYQFMINRYNDLKNCT